MNRELMEKIAKRAEDPNYPYGNKLGKGRSVREATDTAIGLPTLGALVGGALGLPLGGGGALAGAALGGIATAVMTPGAVKNQYAQSEERRAMSYLPSGEQIKLRKELDRLDDMRYKISDKMERMEDRNIGLIDDIESVPQDIAQKYNSLSVKLSDIGAQKHNLSANALARGKALMLAEKKNRRLFKTASADYEEMVKKAYEDIVEGFEKEASTAFDRWAHRNPHAEHSGSVGNIQVRQAVRMANNKSAVGKMIGKIIDNPVAIGKNQVIRTAYGDIKELPGSALREVRGSNKRIRDEHFGFGRGVTLDRIKERAHRTWLEAQDFKKVLADIKANR